MAEYQERSFEDLTEEPTQYRLEELRSQGVAAQSRDLNSTVAFVGVIIVLFFISSKFLEQFTILIKEVFTKDLIQTTGFQDWHAYTDVALRCGKVFSLIFVPIGITAFVLAALTSIAQVGFMFTTQAIEPDLDRINPVSGFFRVFSFRGLFEGLKAILKFLFIAAAVYVVLKSQFFAFPSLIHVSFEQILPYLATTTLKLLAITILFLFIMAGLDYFMQWRQYRQKARMTKQEAKQELKEREGDPQIKARIRSIQRDLARKRMMKAVPKADVIVTNPNHIAVALVYSPEEHTAPKLIAKGADYLAEKIKKIATEHGIPIVENKPLARSLYKHVKVGQLIPRSLYQAVAEILAYVYKLKGKKFLKKTDEKSTEQRL